MIILFIYIFIIIISIYLGFKFGIYYNEKIIKNKLKRRSLISNEALLDYIYNHFKL